MSKVQMGNYPAEVRRIPAKYPNHVPVNCKGGAPGSGSATIRQELLVRHQTGSADLREVIRTHAEGQPAAGSAKGAPLCILAGGAPLEACDMPVSELPRRCRTADGIPSITYLAHLLTFVVGTKMMTAGIILWE